MLKNAANATKPIKLKAIIYFIMELSRIKTLFSNFGEIVSNTNSKLAHTQK